MFFTHDKYITILYRIVQRYIEIRKVYLFLKNMIFFIHNE